MAQTKTTLLDRYHLTFQERRQLEEFARDLQMWQEVSLEERWEALEKQTSPELSNIQKKKFIFKGIREQIQQLKQKPKVYGKTNGPKERKNPLQIQTKESERQIFGDCPVASEKTVCCNLKTLDAVENCAFECSYCTIQTFYGDKVHFDSNLKEKLKKIELDPNRFYHIGTGQSSDSLVWGNKNGILDDLCEFAQKNPNILLEFKTKSDNIHYFLENEIPRNIVCSWSLNTEMIASEEEKFTAPLDKRLKAARAVADRGVKVAFHFHPMVYYQGWQEDYANLAKEVQEQFLPKEVLFISMGSVTFIKPVIQEIRKRGGATKILQMELVKDPHGKLTYPDEIKIKMFQNMFQAFKSWHKNVFFYLCMEHARFWDVVFGWHYPTNEAFEKDFGVKTFSKIS